jgi:GT2 family glycosyltransferase
MPSADVQSASPRLSWALVISTYKRREILLRCLRNALLQSNPPSEVVIVDASPDWQQNREEALLLLAARPEIAVQYVEARRPSLPVQRNQGIDLAIADVLFLIDDDSMMYPDCAAEAMKIYEADVDMRVSGVMCCPAREPPDAAEATASLGASGHAIAQPTQTLLRRLVKSLLNTEGTYFLPYESASRQRELPASLRDLRVGIIQIMAGYAMTFRRSVLLKERFCELLERYAAGEDQDLSYRASRHGLLLLAQDARLCHLEISGGRLSRRTTTALADLNPAAMQVLYSEDVPRVRREWSRIVQKRLLIRLLKDVSEREWTFQRTHGTLLALEKLHSVYECSHEELSSWYGQLQGELIAQDGAGTGLATPSKLAALTDALGLQWLRGSARPQWSK